MDAFTTPRLTRSDVERYARKHSYGPEHSVIALVDRVRERGYLTKAELTIVGEWKSPRIRSRLARNSEEAIREATGLALGTHSVTLAVYVPQALFGVGMPVASTLLHWFHADPFPILDFRALWSMGIEMPKAYSLEFWEQYVDVVRALSRDWGTDLRTLDRALWQFSTEHQPAGS